MTALKTPLIAVFPCFCTGLIIGLLFPSESYLAPTIAVGAFALWASYKSKGVVTDLLILLLCVLIGAQRMSANFQNMEDKTNSTSFIEEKLSRTQEINSAKIQALQELGYTEINQHNASEVLAKIAEIQSRDV